MSDSRIFGRTAQMIGKALDISAKRHNLIAGNIANMDTIGFVPRDLDFKQTLKQAMDEPEPDFLDKRHSDHLSGIEETLSGDMDGVNVEDVDIYHLDSVNIDREMMSLAENNILYRTTTELLLRKMKILQYSIDEGGK